MFLHQKETAYFCKPDAPDPIYARKLQELIGGQWGEMSVMTAYLFQGWNCRGPAKYKDMLLDIGTEEIGHVEMLATMVARLLETSPVTAQEHAARNPAIRAVLGGSRIEDAVLAGMDPQHFIVSGLGATPNDSNGFPFTARYVVASGNMLADFRYNVAAESQGRMQACRMYELSQDRGVRDMLHFNIARDTMHQNQWLAAIEQLKEDGIEDTLCPSTFPQELEDHHASYQFLNHSAGQESKEGRWASGPSMDGRGRFEYVEHVKAGGDAPVLGAVDPRVHGTGPKPVKAEAAPLVS